VVNNLFQSVASTGLLSDHEKDAIRAYVHVMTPLAQSLVIFQTEEDAYMGSLLPYIRHMMQYTKDAATGRYTAAKDLATKVIEQVKIRFNKEFEDKELKLASGFHPKFGTSWLPSSVEEDRLKKDMVDALQAYYDSQTTDSTNWSDDGDGDSSGTDRMDIAKAFTRERTTTRHTDRDGTNRTARVDIEAFLDTCVGGPKWKDQLNHPGIRCMFIKYNTAIPSSAAVERLFSVAKDVLRPKRSCISDTHFNQVMFLRSNRSVLPLPPGLFMPGSSGSSGPPSVSSPL